MPTGLSLEQLLPAAVLISLRIGSLMSFAPFFGGAGLPALSKVVLTVVLTAVLLPVHPSAMIPVTVGGWLQAAGSELLLGLVMALAMEFVFEAARLAGHIMGFQLGYSLVNIIDPQTSVDTPVLSVFTYTFGMLIFLQLNVHHWVLRGLAHSYDVVAPGQAVVTLSSTTMLLHGAAGMWNAGMEVAAPVLAATLLVDILVSFMAKASPQIPVLQIGMAIKSLIGFGVLWTVISRWPNLFEHFFALALRFSERMLISLR